MKLQIEYIVNSADPKNCQVRVNGKEIPAVKVFNSRGRIASDTAPDHGRMEGQPIQVEMIPANRSPKSPGPITVTYQLVADGPPPQRGIEGIITDLSHYQYFLRSQVVSGGKQLSERRQNFGTGATFGAEVVKCIMVIGQTVYITPITETNPQLAAFGDLCSIVAGEAFEFVGEFFDAISAAHDLEKMTGPGAA